MRSKGLVMQTFQLDQAALLPEVYIPESRRNSLLNNNQSTMQFLPSKKALSALRIVVKQKTRAGTEQKHAKFNKPNMITGHEISYLKIWINQLTFLYRR